MDNQQSTKKVNKGGEAFAKVAHIYGKRRRIKNMEKYNSNPTICGHCNKAMPYNNRRNKFCNNVCAAKFNNKQRNKIKRYCITCNKLIKHKGKYCSIKCQNQYAYNLYIADWKKGNKKGSKGEYNISAHIRRYLFEKFNNKCSKCEWSEVNQYTGKIPLEVEHMDGNHKNNEELNLELLCPNCHSLTKTYKGANRGNGRHSRNNRYKEGLSY